MRLFLWAGVAIALIAGAVLSLMPQPIPVDVGEVSRGPMQVTIDEDGRTRIHDRYVVSSPVAGRSMRITLRPGDEVTQGATVLVRIQPARPTLLDARAVAEAQARVDAMQATMKRAGALLDQARAQRELAETRLGRLQKLASQDSVSQNELDQARAEHLLAQARFRSAKFNQEIAQFELKMAEATLSYTTDDEGTQAEPFELVSPITGQVLRVMQESATFVQPGTPLLEIGNPRDLEIEIDVLSTDAVKISAGDPVLLEHWGGDQPLRAKVRRVEPAAFTKISALGVEEQRVHVLADFDEPNQAIERLGDGYRIEASIVIWQADDVLRIPTAALFRANRDWTSFAVTDSNRVRRHTLQLGHRNDDWAEVLGGIEEGQAVVLYPGDQIETNVKVQPRRQSR